MRAAVGPGLGTCILNKFPSHAAPVGLGLCSESPSTSVENGVLVPTADAKTHRCSSPCSKRQICVGPELGVFRLSLCHS